MQTYINASFNVSFLFLFFFINTESFYSVISEDPRPRDRQVVSSYSLHPNFYLYCIRNKQIYQFNQASYRTQSAFVKIIVVQPFLWMKKIMHSFFFQCKLEVFTVYILKIMSVLFTVPHRRSLTDMRKSILTISRFSSLQISLTVQVLRTRQKCVVSYTHDQAKT